MGFLSQSDTLYSTAYLTEHGRHLLWNGDRTRFETQDNSLGSHLGAATLGSSSSLAGASTFSTSFTPIIDNFRIEYFTLGDPDVNYRLNSGIVLDSGEVPDISGENENCVKGCVKTELKNMISYLADGVIDSTDAASTVIYEISINSTDNTDGADLNTAVVSI